MSKVIVHIDLNAFFVRCEEIKDPSLEGKPVAVGHEGRGGIVSTCSYKAREFGARSGMPMFKAKQLCPNLIIKPVDFRFYYTLSHEFIDFIKNYTKEIEIASIDECYADFTNVVKGIMDVPAFFKDLQNRLFIKTKLKCSIGVAATKFLAKMGSDYRKPMGLTIIRKSNIPKILYPLSIDNMYGIGKKTAPRLNEIGIKTIGDFAREANSNNLELQKVLGKFYFVLKDWVNGKGSDKIIKEVEDPKSIGNSLTLKHDTNNKEDILPTFEFLCREVSSRAIKERKLGSTIQIVVKDQDFKSYNKSLTLNNPTNKFDILYQNAVFLYEQNFLDKVIRLVGVTLQNLINVEDATIQMSLFDYQKHEEESTTKLLINDLNRRFSKPYLMRASEVKKNDGNK